MDWIFTLFNVIDEFRCIYYVCKHVLFLVLLRETTEIHSLIKSAYFMIIIIY